MTSEAAVSILQNMMDGIDPNTGEFLSEDHICNSPNVMRALHMAILSLSSGSDQKKGASDQGKEKLNAGRPWSVQDLDELEHLYRSGVPVSAICKQLQRRERGVKKQLAYLGLIESSAQPHFNPPSGLERAGLRWIRDEDLQLKKLYHEKRPIADIASEMHRSEYSIFCRMEKLELYGSECGYPVKDDLPKWTNEDGHRLRELFQSGRPIAEIAADMKRPEKSISARLFYMGLTRKSPLGQLKKEK